MMCKAPPQESILGASCKELQQHVQRHLCSASIQYKPNLHLCSMMSKIPWYIPCESPKPKTQAKQ